MPLLAHEKKSRRLTSGAELTGTCLADAGMVGTWFSQPLRSMHVQKTIRIEQHTALRLESMLLREGQRLLQFCFSRRPTVCDFKCPADLLRGVHGPLTSEPLDKMIGHPEREGVVEEGQS